MRGMRRRGLRSRRSESQFFTVVQDGDGGRLVKTVSFSTPSGAADFVLGGSNNGWIEWKDGDKQTLDALYRK